MIGLCPRLFGYAAKTRLMRPGAGDIFAMIVRVVAISFAHRFAAGGLAGLVQANGKTRAAASRGPGGGAWRRRGRLSRGVVVAEEVFKEARLCRQYQARGDDDSGASAR
jgi:hypothetical protein